MKSKKASAKKEAFAKDDLVTQNQALKMFPKFCQIDRAADGMSLLSSALKRVLITDDMENYWDQATIIRQLFALDDVLQERQDRRYAEARKAFENGLPVGKKILKTEVKERIAILRTLWE